MKRFFCFSSLLLLFLIQAVGANSGPYKVQNTSTPPQDISNAIKSLLQAQGVLVNDDQGKTWCEVWIRKEIANTNQPASPEAKYPGLHLGSLVGVLRFPSTGADFRGQPIKPGTYTLRYALIPQDGNHMGAAPILDFVLLIPASEDNKEPDAVLKVEEMVSLSRKASGTNHPAVFNLAPPPVSVSAPVVEKNDMNYWVLKTNTKLKPEANLPLGIIVVGTSEH